MEEKDRQTIDTTMMEKKGGILKRFYVFSFLMLFIPTIGGYIIGYYNPEIAKSVLESAYGDISFIQQFTSFELFVYIFVRNSLIGLILMVSGIVIGIPTLLILMSNGLIIGAVVGWVIREVGAIVAIMSILPHGIIEIPAVVICGAYGLYIGASSMGKLRRRKDIVLKEIIKRSIGTYIRKPLIMFAVAAAVEAYITPFLVKQVMESAAII